MAGQIYVSCPACAWRKRSLCSHPLKIRAPHFLFTTPLQAELAVAEDFDQIRSAMEKCPPYQAIFSRVRRALRVHLFVSSEAAQMCAAVEAGQERLPVMGLQQATAGRQHQGGGRGGGRGRGGRDSLQHDSRHAAIIVCSRVLPACSHLASARLPPLPICGAAGPG